MLATTRACTLDGISARPVRVEVDVHRGLPNFSIVGLPDAAVREARERVRAALVNSGFDFPLRRVVVNLAPASLRKAGPGMDLAIAAALLAAAGEIAWEGGGRLALVGELSLDGSTRPVQGALAMAEAAREAGAEAILVPAENGPEAALAYGIRVVPIEALSQLPALLAGESHPSPPEPMPLQLATDPSGPDLADLRGQPELRHALEVAAAGQHSLLLIGPPGAGKSLAVSRLPSILPPLDVPEALEVTRIASATGRLQSSTSGGRPLRAPHHTISAAGLVGGGSPSRPGEATLAHRGILFLDELPEFRRDALEALRAPLETAKVAVARAGNQITLPGDFLLTAAANPCPCGRGEADPDCSCSPYDLQRYQAKLTGALADRIEIRTSVRQPSTAEIGGSPGESSELVRERVISARERQHLRLGQGRCNAHLTPAEARACPLSSSAADVLADLYARQRLSGDAHDRTLRLAQTLADLDGVDVIGEDQMRQALRMRRPHPAA